MTKPVRDSGRMRFTIWTIFPVEQQHGGTDMADATVSTTDSGPYWVSGNFVIADANGNEFSVEGDAYLCRCGQSSDKPFCDGTHNSAGFIDECRAA